MWSWERYLGHVFCSKIYIGPFSCENILAGMKTRGRRRKTGETTGRTFVDAYA